MTKTFNIRAIIATTVASAALASINAAAFASDSIAIGAMKPLQGLSFEIGGKRAASYFLAQGDTCQLVLTVADAPDLLVNARHVATRFEADVPAGQSTRFSEGVQAIDFSCHAGAMAMSAVVINQIATGSSDK